MIFNFIAKLMWKIDDNIQIDMEEKLKNIFNMYISLFWSSFI